MRKSIRERKNYLCVFLKKVLKTRAFVPLCSKQSLSVKLLAKLAEKHIFEALIELILEEVLR